MSKTRAAVLRLLGALALAGGYMVWTAEPTLATCPVPSCPNGEGYYSSCVHNGGNPPYTAYCTWHCFEAQPGQYGVDQLHCDPASCTPDCYQ